MLSENEISFIFNDEMRIRNTIPNWVKRKKVSNIDESDEHYEIVKRFEEAISHDDADFSAVGRGSVADTLPTFSDSRIKVLENPLLGCSWRSRYQDIIVGAVRAYRAETDNKKELVSVNAVMKLYKGLPYFTAKLIRKVLCISRRQAQYYMSVIGTVNLLINSFGDLDKNLAQQI